VFTRTSPDPGTVYLSWTVSDGSLSAQCASDASDVPPPDNGWDASAVPALVGLLFGAPLLGREFELGTWRLVWAQGVSRTCRSTLVTSTPVTVRSGP